MQGVLKFKKKKIRRQKVKYSPAIYAEFFQNVSFLHIFYQNPYIYFYYQPHEPQASPVSSALLW